MPAFAKSKIKTSCFSEYSEKSSIIIFPPTLNIASPTSNESILVVATRFEKLTVVIFAICFATSNIHF